MKNVGLCLCVKNGFDLIIVLCIDWIVYNFLLFFILFSLMVNIYINLPVADLPKATAFYEAIGFTKNPDFSDENASGMVYDETLSVMLLTHDFTKKFLPEHKRVADSHTTCEVLNAVQLDTKEAVDAFYEKAIAA
jgi:predicted lactoylglutathione lyase